MLSRNTGKLAEAGFSVVILDAGPHWDPAHDFVSDETASHKLFWTDERVTAGCQTSGGVCCLSCIFFEHEPLRKSLQL
jgi:hypothetical protein